MATLEFSFYIYVMIEYYKNLSLEPLFYINDKGLVCLEEWRDVPGYSGYYQVSMLGRIKSLGNNKFKTIKIMKCSISGDRYASVCFSKNGIKHRNGVHVFVAMAFLNHVPCGHKIVVDHKKNENSLDNSIFNLQIITHRENDSKDSKNKTGHVGVVKTPGGKYSAIAVFDKKSINLGVFDLIEDAVNARKKAIELHLENKEYNIFKPKKEIDVYSCVYPKRNSFYARIRVDNKTINLGTYKTKEEAYESRRIALIKYGFIEP